MGEVKIFLSSAKKWKDKEKTIQYGFDHPRRYHMQFSNVPEKREGESKGQSTSWREGSGSNWYSVGRNNVQVGSEIKEFGGSS